MCSFAGVFIINEVSLVERAVQAMRNINKTITHTHTHTPNTDDTACIAIDRFKTSAGSYYRYYQYTLIMFLLVMAIRNAIIITLNLGTKDALQFVFYVENIRK